MTTGRTLPSRPVLAKSEDRISLLSVSAVLLVPPLAPRPVDHDEDQARRPH
jgi:hypothetical protein